MTVNYPIVFTISGRGWRNSPISVTLKYGGGTKVSTGTLNQTHLQQGDFSIVEGPVSGYFMSGGDQVRVTNLVGAQNGVLLKSCPHCGKIKPIYEFDDSGRFTGEQRDQSNCNDCRSSY